MAKDTGIKATVVAVFGAFGEFVIEACGTATSAARATNKTVQMVEREVDKMTEEQEFELEEARDVLNQRKLERRAKQAGLTVEEYIKANPQPKPSK